ncbi:DNA phosphorothioation-dependent restriction protein DptH [Amphritea sp. 1_MG-2023]|uniref:DNA phosphorothioation-dependent restriction protein DptH n=1 Tax=Amphritea sp. 1_MG-2023 TaxID=3062670 RepID=UPI0026E494E0|nr:DNA phosphorothioation-dependent restriction protein DptH [Amphritea sp. 1_MG-2023]MDO6562647.1 DNA phosphorothioation-dependent restriction protein DptH [Amphritea sp. 1_MG-2023]
MSVRQFEEFLVGHFLEWANTGLAAGFRYQFQSPNVDSSLKLHKAFVKEGDLGGFLDVRGVKLPFIRCGNINLIPVIHGEGNAVGYTENFISYLRDKVSDQQGVFSNSALFIMHNSLLDTLINSADDLTVKGCVFDLINIKTSLEALIDETDAEKGKDVSRILLDYQFDLIVEDKGSMFGFESLYMAISDGNIRFHEINLLNDPAILQMQGEPEQIRKRLDKNRELREEIADVLEHYPDQLEDNLPDFSKAFIDKYFRTDDPDAWQKVSFDEYRKEQDKNREQQLLIVDENSASGKLIVRSKNKSKTAQKERHILLVVDDGEDEFDFLVKFEGGKVLNSEVRLSDKCKELTVKENVKLRGGSVNTDLLVTGKVRDVPRFFMLSLNRPKTSEKFKFKCLVVKQGQFNTEEFENSFLINPSKRIVTLQTPDTELKIALNGCDTRVTRLNTIGQCFDVVEQDIIDFEQISNEVDRISFTVKNGPASLMFDVEGAAPTEMLTLPLMFDQSRGFSMFSEDLFGVYNRLKRRVYIENKEVKSDARNLELLDRESLFIDKKLLFINDESVDDEVSTGFTLASLKLIDAGLGDAYEALYAYYSRLKTLPSLCGWGEEYRALVTVVVRNYYRYLEGVPDKQYLQCEQKIVLTLGMMTVAGEDHITSFHPLVLAYYLELAEQAVADSSNSFRYLPKVTLQRLNPQGLLPFIYDDEHSFSYVKVLDNNCFWMRCVPHQETNYGFVTKLVKDKIAEFSQAFSSLFKLSKGDSARPVLIINSVNNHENRELFFGIVGHVAKHKNKTFDIHVNIYDDSLSECEFDRFSEMASYEKIKQCYGLNKGVARDHADTIVDLLRTRVTYSKFAHKESDEQVYAHLTFFRNNQKVKVVDVNPDERLSGVSCHGLINGEASASEQGNYVTGFGLNNVDYEELLHVKIAVILGRMYKPAREAAIEYRDNSAIALAVDDKFKSLLERSYDSSIWTSIIDPKVTLDFFENSQDMLLIHYSDQYTSSASYDAITVTRQTDLYDKVLEKDEGGLIGEFNAFNGEWLLKMITDPPKIRKERKGILAAYKMISCLLANSDITWVPMSAAEMVRVSGNIGLNMSESEFSRHLNGYKSGAISDDVLFVGFKGESLYLLPLEVKTGVSYDKKKAIKQAQELSRYLADEVLSGDALSRKLYRSLFIRQALMQIDKYELYSVYPDNYFSAFLDRKEWWLEGDYDIAELVDYPRGFVVANLQGKQYIETKVNEVEGVLIIECPYGFLSSMITVPLQKLLSDVELTSAAKIPSRYFLGPTPESLNLPIKKPILVSGISSESEDSSDLTGSEGIVAHTEAAECRVLIGTNVQGDKPVYWEFDHKDLPNRHIIIFGRSGQGKTYCIQGLLMDLASNNVNSMVVDYTNGFLPDQLEAEFNVEVNPKTDLVAHAPLALNPFERQSQMVAGYNLTDKSHDVAARIASVFNSVYSTIGEQQLPTMIRVIEEGLDLYGADYGFEKMLSDLNEAGKVGEALANKLMPMVKANIFSTNTLDIGWENIYKSEESRTRLIQLATLPRDVWRLATEFILWDLYAYACSSGNKSKPLPVILDEVQNLDHRLDSPLGKMLTEGRKYGLSLILATQTLSNLKKDEQDRLFQAAHKLFFAPAETEIKKYAEILEVTVKGSTRQHWIEELSSLSKGYCLSVGYHLNDDEVLELGVKKVHVSALGSRVSDEATTAV